jgi:hypothetical protein
VVGAGRQATGTLTYRPGDGLTTLTSKEPRLWAIGRSLLVLHADLANRRGEARFLSFELRELRAGEVRSYAGDDSLVCLSLPSDHERIKTCLPFSGTADVKMFASSCQEHESGIGTCAASIDVTIRGTASSGTTTLDVDLTVTAAERWSDTSCAAN